MRKPLRGQYFLGRKDRYEVGWCEGLHVAATPDSPCANSSIEYVQDFLRFHEANVFFSNAACALVDTALRSYEEDQRATWSSDLPLISDRRGVIPVDLRRYPTHESRMPAPKPDQRSLY